MTQRTHNVDADYSVVGNFFGFADFTAKCAHVGFLRIFPKIGLIETGLCSGNDADSAFLCDRPGQTGKADADSHATLNDRDTCD